MLPIWTRRFALHSRQSCASSPRLRCVTRTLHRLQAPTNGSVHRLRLHRPRPRQDKTSTRLPQVSAISSFMISVSSSLFVFLFPQALLVPFYSSCAPPRSSRCANIPTKLGRELSSNRQTCLPEKLGWGWFPTVKLVYRRNWGGAGFQPSNLFTGEIGVGLVSLLL